MRKGRKVQRSLTPLLDVRISELTCDVESQALLGDGDSAPGGADLVDGLFPLVLLR